MIDPAWLLAPALFYPLYEATHPRLRDVTIRSPFLPPAWDGLTLLYFSDTHTRQRGRLERNLERLLTGVETDLLLLGGDHGVDREGYEIALRAARGVKVRLGKYASWGNSESLKHVSRDELRGVLGEEGFTVLANDNLVFERGGESLALCAVDCPYSHKDDFDATFSGLPDDLYRILLMHAPEGLLSLGRHRADLILSGHTHGGQIRFPGLPPLSLHTRTEVDLDRGVFDAGSLRRYWTDAPDEAKMILSAGIGTSTAPVRLFCPPEVTQVTLRTRE